MRTFFLPADKWQEPYTLEGQEAKHLVAVLRAKAGESIRLLDGEGREGIFTITHIEKHTVLLKAAEIHVHPRPAASATLALGYNKALRRSWLMEKAVELEAQALWLWQADRSQGKMPEDGKDSWLNQMQAGAKQCNNPWLPQLRILPGGVKDIVAAKTNFTKTYVLWEGESGGTLLRYNDLDTTGHTLFVVGPEGGFTNREITYLCDNAFMPVSLGHRVLRWETAALLCLGFSWWARQEHYITMGNNIELSE